MTPETALVHVPDGLTFLLSADLRVWAAWNRNTPEADAKMTDAEAHNASVWYAVPEEQHEKFMEFLRSEKK